MNDDEYLLKYFVYPTLKITTSDFLLQSVSISIQVKGSTSVVANSVYPSLFIHPSCHPHHPSYPRWLFVMPPEWLDHQGLLQVMIPVAKAVER